MAVLLNNSTCLVKRTLTTNEVAKVMNDCIAEEDRSRVFLRFSPTLPSATPKKDVNDSLDALKLNNILVQRPQAVRQMLPRHPSMWSGQCKKIDTVQHRITKQPGANLCTRRPYGAGLIVKVTIKRNVDTMPQQEVIEPAQKGLEFYLALVP